MKTKKNNGKNGTALIGIALILLCLAAVSGSMLSGIMAKYTITATSSDSARVAAFNVRADLSNSFERKTEVGNNVTVGLDGEHYFGENDSYEFIVSKPLATDERAYVLDISMKRGEEESEWPEGLIAKLWVSDDDGETWSETPIESAEGKFDLNDLFADTDEEALKCRVSFDKGETEISGDYFMDIMLSVNNVADIFAGPENPARYLFDAQIDTEVTTKYSVEVTINNKNEDYDKGWPEGLIAKLWVSDDNGETWSETPIESDDGTFTPENEDDWVVPAGTTKELSFRLSFETSYTTIGGTYDMVILVIMEQQD